MNTEIFKCAVSAKVATFASIVTKTIVKIPKKWGFSEEVTCVTEKNGQLNYSYESAVNRHRLAEGKENDFEAESLPWGEWLVPNLVIVHKDKHYLRFYDIKGGLISKTYFVGGRKATDAEVEVINTWKASQKHSSRQGVDNEVKPTAICFDNIQYLACGGNKYGSK